MNKKSQEKKSMNLEREDVQLCNKISEAIKRNPHDVEFMIAYVD